MWIKREEYNALVAERDQLLRETKRLIRHQKLHHMMLEAVGAMAFDMADGKGMRYEVDENDNPTRIYSNELAPYIDELEKTRAQTQE